MIKNNLVGCPTSYIHAQCTKQVWKGSFFDRAWTCYVEVTSMFALWALSVQHIHIQTKNSNLASVSYRHLQISTQTVTLKNLHLNFV